MSSGGSTWVSPPFPRVENAFHIRDIRSDVADSPLKPNQVRVAPVGGENGAESFFEPKRSSVIERLIEEISGHCLEKYPSQTNIRNPRTKTHWFRSSFLNSCSACYSIQWFWESRMSGIGSCPTSTAIEWLKASMDERIIHNIPLSPMWDTVMWFVML